MKWLFITVRHRMFFILKNAPVPHAEGTAPNRRRLSPSCTVRAVIGRRHQTYCFLPQVYFWMRPALREKLFTTPTTQTCSLCKIPWASVVGKHQQRFSVNVWAGILGDYLLSCLLPERLNGVMYRAFQVLVAKRPLVISSECERPQCSEAYDSALAHFSREMRNHQSLGLFPLGSPKSSHLWDATHRRIS